jgi:hypothetical protein
VDPRTRRNGGKRFDAPAHSSHSSDTIGAVADRLNRSKASNDETPQPGKVRSVSARIFSQVCSYIANHPGTEDSRILAEVLKAIDAGRAESCFDALSRIEPSARDLGLELLKANFDGAFPPQAWKDTYRLANQLNNRSNENAVAPSATVRESNVERKQVPIAHHLASEREPVSATVKAGNLEAHLAPPPPRRPFWHRARTRLLYVYERARSDSLNYLVGAAAAATVVGSFMLAIALDEGVFEDRPPPALPLPESQELQAEMQVPIPAEVDELSQQVSEGAPNPGSVQAENESLAESAPENATVLAEVEPVIAPDVPSPPQEERAMESAAAIDNELAAAPSPTLEGMVAADSSLREDARLNPGGPSAEEASAAVVSEPQHPKSAQKKIEPARPPRVAESKASGFQNKARAMPLRPAQSRPESARTVKNEPPKPLQAAAQRKAKSDELAKKPSVAGSVAPPANAPTVEMPEDISSSTEVKASSIEPPAQTIRENPELPPAAATVQAPNTAVSVAQPSPAPIAQSESEPVPEAKPVQKRETLLEDWLGFKPRDVIGKFQQGRRTDQPSFIRQLENVQGAAGD